VGTEALPERIPLRIGLFPRREGRDHHVLAHLVPGEARKEESTRIPPRFVKLNGIIVQSSGILDRRNCEVP
jgi:hypothetical protein